MAAATKTKKADEAGDDQSMEEILQSIRKIIAEEGDAPSSAPAEDDGGILELTDAMQEPSAQAPAPAAAEADILADIDLALDGAGDSVMEEPQPEPEPMMPAPQPVAAPKPIAPKPMPAVTAGVEEGLLSAASMAASAEALRALKAPAHFGEMPFHSGDTVEGLVQQLLKPMLKEWLDAHLPSIVLQVVEREVRRVSSAVEEN